MSWFGLFEQCICVYTCILSCREVSDSDKRAGEALHCLAEEVVELVKGVCGKERFSKAYAAAHRKALDTRDQRRQLAALEVCVCAS